MRGSYSSQSSAQSTPSASVTSSAVPIGVGSRSRWKDFRRLRAHRSFPVRPRRPRPTDAAPHRRATAASVRRATSNSAGDGRRPSGAAIARSNPTSAAGKASGSRSSRMAMYCAVHSPIPGSARNFAMASSRLAPRLKISGSAAMILRQCAGRPGARAGHAERGQIGARQSRSADGNRCVRPSPSLACARQWIAVSLHQLAEQLGGGGHRDLLAEDGAHRELKAVPRAGHAQARAAPATSGASTGSSARCAPMVSGSAARSNTRRTRAMICGSAAMSGKRTVTSTRFLSAGVTPITPQSPPIAMVRR